MKADTDTSSNLWNASSRKPQYPVWSFRKRFCKQINVSFLQWTQHGKCISQKYNNYIKHKNGNDSIYRICKKRNNTPLATATSLRRLVNHGDSRCGTGSKRPKQSIPNQFQRKSSPIDLLCSLIQVNYATTKHVINVANIIHISFYESHKRN